MLAPEELLECSPPEPLPLYVDGTCAPAAGPAHVDRAVAAARAALDGPWGATLAMDRARVLAVKAGTVWINNYRLWNWLMPFGGYKQSGYGREHGLEVMEHYTQTKSVWVDLQDEPADWFAS